jgi:hypothetical protein
MKIAPRMPRSYITLFAVAAFTLLAGMEATDLWSAGRPITNIGDLLGGSIPLRPGVTIAIALGFAHGIWRTACRATGMNRVAVRIISAWFLLTLQAAPTGSRLTTIGRSATTLGGRCSVEFG